MLQTSMGLMSIVLSFAGHTNLILDRVIVTPNHVHVAPELARDLVLSVNELEHRALTKIRTKEVLLKNRLLYHQTK